MNTDRRILVEIGIAAALGAGMATMLAIAFEQLWWLGTLSGALIAGVAYRPKEVIAVIRKIPPEELVTFCQMLSIIFGLCAGLLFFHLWIVLIFEMEVMSLVLGAATFLAVVLFIMGTDGTGDPAERFYKTLATYSGWFMPLSRLAGKFLGWLGEKPMPAVALHPWNRVVLVALVLVVLPTLAVLSLLSTLLILCIDTGVTGVLALASNSRLASIEGALLGGLWGFGWYVYMPNAMPTLAVVVGMIAGFVAGPFLYQLRETLAVKFAPQAAVE